MPFADYFRGGLGFRTGGLAGQRRAGLARAVAHARGRAPEPVAPCSRKQLAEATQVQFQGLEGVLPGYARMAPNDWGLGFELRDAKSPHWTGALNSPRTFGHFGGSGTFLWVDPDAGLALGVLTDLEFGDWAKDAWPRLPWAQSLREAAERREPCGRLFALL